ncbi:unnamed protein product, partial [Choristocarpus tenellus]
MEPVSSLPTLASILPNPTTTESEEVTRTKVRTEPRDLTSPSQQTESRGSSRPKTPKDKENGAVVRRDRSRRQGVMSKFALLSISSGTFFRLPSTAIVGRDSVRDKNNKHKLVLGIPTSEQGVSREQANLVAGPDSNRVSVQATAKALNPVRIRRGGNGVMRDNVVLKCGKKDVMYLGDTLEIDGFRLKSKFAYTLCLWTESKSGDNTLGDHVKTEARSMGPGSLHHPGEEGSANKETPPIHTNKEFTNPIVSSPKESPRKKIKTTPEYVDISGNSLPPVPIISTTAQGSQLTYPNSWGDQPVGPNNTLANTISPSQLAKTSSN